jgi:hypothetical protein
MATHEIWNPGILSIFEQDFERRLGRKQQKYDDHDGDILVSNSDESGPLCPDPLMSDQRERIVWSVSER